MYCRTCGNKMNDNAEICVKCGVKRNVGNAFCQVCGAKTTASMTNCGRCGAKLLSALSTVQVKEKAVTAVSKTKRVIGKIALFIGICAFIGAAGCALFATFFMNPNSYSQFSMYESAGALSSTGAILVIIGRFLKKKS
ncbi:MAG: hypothetical protein J6C96_08035 [Oscillospiraceae bacterium]|nr:hypothetical protein [Oscillospiraceae bacterium]